MLEMGVEVEDPGFRNSGETPSYEKEATKAQGKEPLTK